jgi:CDP-glycerol glycerophosphotransferase (TagB/SpsB family)
MDRQLDDPFVSDVLFTRDPRQIFPPQIWSFIERGKVRLGMTEDQARASWGHPASINRTRTRHGVSEQWSYDGWYLYFTNGRLMAVQD